MLAITTRRRLTQEQFLAFGEQVEAEIGERPAMPTTAGFNWLGYCPHSPEKLAAMQADYDAKYAAARAWDRAFKARIDEIAAHSMDEAA